MSKFVITLVVFSLYSMSFASTPPIRQELGNNWQFRQYHIGKWLPAEVPGTVHTDLINNGIIEDPFYRDNEKHIQWIDKADWEYELRFQVDEQLAGQKHKQLVFQGLDTWCDITLNGQPLLSTNNMFRTWKADVSGLLSGKENILHLRFRSPIRQSMEEMEKYGLPLPASNDQSENGGMGPNRVSVFSRKAPYHFGWDWGPRLVTSGIWRPIFLEGWDDLNIEQVFIEQPHILDKALMRAGRFDRQIEVGLPDVKEREEIFNVHLRPLKLDPQLDRSFLARQTPGFSGADIANVCNEAALIAARHNKKFISKEDFLAAIDRIVGGLERKNKIITDEEKRVIAFHEAGHATVSWILEHASPLIKVTIIPRGKALGAAWYLPEERQITTREQMMDELAATLGGRVSEQLTFGEISTGALNDLERVTKQAYAMVAYYGMSENVGTLSFYDSTGQSDMAFTKPYSELTAQQIDAEAKQVIEKAYKMAETVLREHADGLKELAELLLSREVVFTEDVERIFGRRKKDIERERREAEAKARAEGGKPAGEEPQAGKQAAAVADPSAKSDKSETAEPAPVAPAVAAPETE